MVGGREALRFAAQHPNKPSRLPLSSRRDGHAADMPNMSEVGQTRRAGSIDGSSAAFVVNAPFSRMADGRPRRGNSRMPPGA